MDRRDLAPNYIKRRRNGYSGGLTSYYRGLIASIIAIIKEALEITHSYHVELAAHFIIFCSTLVILILMLMISESAISFCEGILKTDPLIIKALFYASDGIISVLCIKQLLKALIH